MDHFLLDREAAAICTDNVAAHAACRKGQQSVKVAMQTVAMIVTVRKSNRNRPVPQQMLRVLASRLNALSVPVEHVIVNSLELFSGNCINFLAVVCFLVLPECMDSFYTVYLLNYCTHKSYTSHFVHWELVLLESGQNFLRHFAADSCLK